MASPGKEFDPNRKYKVVLSDRLLKNSNDSYLTAGLQVDPDLKIPSNVKVARINPSLYSDDECSLQVTTTASAPKRNYPGSQSTTKTLALIWSPSTQTFVLDKIDTSFSFPLDQPLQSNSPQIRSQDPDVLRTAIIEEEGSPDPDNPYDWRHQLKRHSPSPDLEPFDPLNLDALGTPSPETRPVKRSEPVRRRQASTPPSSSPSAVDSPIASPTGSTQDLASPLGGLEMEMEEEEESGGLEIDWGGAAKPRSRFSRGRTAFQTFEGGPISLRSAASSRSPALRGYDGEDGESDEDVEGLRLGSPISKSRKNERADIEIGLGNEDVDMDEEEEEAHDDFEAAFEEALEEDEDDDEVVSVPPQQQQQQRYEESSSESEAD